MKHVKPQAVRNLFHFNIALPLKDFFFSSSSHHHTLQWGQEMSILSPEAEKKVCLQITLQ